MKKLSLMAVLFLGIVVLMSFSRDKGTQELKLGAKAPMSDLKMKNIDGSELSLVDAKKAKGLIVVFSCNTCPFVVGTEDFPGWEKDYNSLAKLAAEKDLGFILVNSNEAKRTGVDSIDEMKIKAKDRGYTMPYLVDENSVLADAFGAKTTPHVYMFNADLKLVYMGSIDNSWDSKRESDVPYLQNAMNEMLNGKVSENETKPVGCSIKRASK